MRGYSGDAIYADHKGGPGMIDIDLEDVTIETQNDSKSRGIFAKHGGTGDVDVNVRGGSIRTRGSPIPMGLMPKIQIRVQILPSVSRHGILPSRPGAHRAMASMPVIPVPMPGGPLPLMSEATYTPAGWVQAV